MKQLTIITSLVLLLILGACNSNEAKEKVLVGEWNSYMIARGGEPVSQNATFAFENGTYIYNIGSYHEEGDYWVEGDKLYTEGPNVMKKKVEIAKLKNDTLILKMNDKGVPMSMGFVKKSNN